MQNLWPWEAYHFYKMRMSKRNLSAVNETLLFHGSSKVNPMTLHAERMCIAANKVAGVEQFISLKVHNTRISMLTAAPITENLS